MSKRKTIISVATKGTILTQVGSKVSRKYDFKTS